MVLGVGRLGRWYRRYRFNNKYDSPLLFMILDLGIGVAKLLFIGLCLWGAWLALASAGFV